LSSNFVTQPASLLSVQIFSVGFNVADLFDHAQPKGLIITFKSYLNMKTVEMRLRVGYDGLEVVVIILNVKGEAQTSVVFESGLTAEVEVWGGTEMDGVFVAGLIKTLAVNRDVVGMMN